MYSRYIPKESGGFEHRRVPERGEREAASTPPPLPSAPPAALQSTPPAFFGSAHFEATAGGGRLEPHAGGHDPPLFPARHDPSPPSARQGEGLPQDRGVSAAPSGGALRTRPPGQRPGDKRPYHPQGYGPVSGPAALPGLGGLGGLLGADGPLGRLLPRGLDGEELLVLAVLLLSMKQDGATGSELMIAAGLYLFLL